MDRIYEFLTFVIFRYASLYFVVGIEPGDNELIALEAIHRYVELLDKYFGNVRCCLKFYTPLTYFLFVY